MWKSSTVVASFQHETICNELVAWPVGELMSMFSVLEMCEMKFISPLDVGQGTAFEVYCTARLSRTSAIQGVGSWFPVFSFFISVP